MVTWADVQHVMKGIGKCRYEYSNISLSIRTMGGQRNHTLIQEIPFKDENKPRQRTSRRKKRENVKGDKLHCIVGVDVRNWSV